MITEWAIATETLLDVADDVFEDELERAVVRLARKQNRIPYWVHLVLYLILVKIDD